MSLRAVGAAIAAATNLCLAIIALSRNRRMTLYRTFSFTSFCLFIWNFFNIFYIATTVKHRLVGVPLAGQPEVISRVLLFQRLNSIGLVFLPTAVFHFALSLTEKKDRTNLSILKIAYVVSFLFLASLATPLFTGFQTVYWSRVFTCFLIPLLLYSVYLVFWRYRVSQLPAERNRLRYLLAGGVIGIGGGVTDLAGVFRIRIPPVGNITNAFYAVIVAVAIIRHRLLDIRVVFNRILSFAIVVLVFAGVFLLLFFLPGEPVPIIYLGVILAASLIVLVYQPLKEKVRLFTEKLVLRDKYGYQRTLRDLSTAMTTVTEEDELARLFVDSVSTNMGISQASLALADEHRETYRTIYSLGPGPSVHPLAFRSDNPLLGYLARKPLPLVKEEIERQVQLGNLGSERRTQLRQVVDALEESRAEACVPLRAREGLIGILNLGPKEEKTMYTSADLELLALLADEAALALENIRMWEGVRRGDRLRALGEMAASVAHEVRNPLAAIRSSAQSLQGEVNDSELPGIIMEEVDRLNSLVSEFLDFSRPLKPKLRPCNIVDTIESALELIEKEGSLDNIEVVKSFGEQVPPVLADPDQMKQVLINLFLNAAQAMPSGGRLTTEVRAHLDRVEIEVKDTGCGIEQGELERIFDPFFTTKERGAGLGLSIVRRIVDAHKGTISAQSTVREGTTITVSLPTRARLQEDGAYSLS